MSIMAENVRMKQDTGGEPASYLAKIVLRTAGALAAISVGLHDNAAHAGRPTVRHRC
jgi:hypothetical protein